MTQVLPSTNESETANGKPEEKPRPRKRITREQLTSQVNAELEQQESIDEEVEQMELQKVLESNDVIGGTVRLERRGPGEGKFAYVEKLKTATFDIDHIKTVWGGGDYAANFHRSDGRMFRRVEFSIDPRVQGRVDLQNKVAAPGATDTGVTGKLTDALVAQQRQDPAQAAMLTKMMESSNQNMMLMMTMMQESSKQNMAMMSGMMTAMASAMGTKMSMPAPVNQGFTMQDLVAMIGLLNQNKGTANPTLAELTQVMINLKELSANGAEGAAEEPQDFMSKLTKMMPHISNTIATLRGQPQTQIATDEPKKIETKAKPEAPSQLNVVLGLIVNAAQRNSEVGLYHDFLLDQISEQEEALLKAALTQPDWFATLFSGAPNADTIKPWIEKLREMVLATLSEPNGPSSDNPTGVQSGSNPNGAVAGS